MHITGRPFTSSCVTPTEKASGFSDSQLKEVMQAKWSYITGNNNFIKKIKYLKTNCRCYPSIPLEAGLRALKEILDRREKKKISTENLVKMAEFMLKNNYFECNSQV